MLEEERIKLAITLQAFLQGYHRQHEKWDEFFPFRSKDPDCAIVIEYCNHVETLYPSVARNTWSNEEGEASIWKILHMLIEPLPFAEIEQFIAGEYHKFGLKMKNGNTHTTNEESW